MKRHYIPITCDIAEISESRKAWIRKVIRTALEAEGVDFRCEVDVCITDDEGIREINREMREVDKATDVLSFPVFDLTPGELQDEEDADPCTGLVPLVIWPSPWNTSPPRPRNTATAKSVSFPIWWCIPCCICWATIIWTKAR